jgi:hypothetical protein
MVGRVERTIDIIVEAWYAFSDILSCPERPALEEPLNDNGISIRLVPISVASVLLYTIKINDRKVPWGREWMGGFLADR